MGRIILMEFDVEVFAERVRLLRNKMGINTIQLAKGSGIPNATISRWENGIMIPKADSIYTLSKFFGVTAGYLIGTEDNP